MLTQRILAPEILLVSAALEKLMLGRQSLLSCASGPARKGKCELFVLGSVTQGRYGKMVWNIGHGSTLHAFLGGGLKHVFIFTPKIGDS